MGWKAVTSPFFLSLSLWGWQQSALSCCGSWSASWGIPCHLKPQTMSTGVTAHVLVFRGIKAPSPLTSLSYKEVLWNSEGSFLPVCPSSLWLTPLCHLLGQMLLGALSVSSTTWISSWEAISMWPLLHLDFLSFFKVFSKLFPIFYSWISSKCSYTHLQLSWHYFQ